MEAKECVRYYMSNVPAAARSSSFRDLKLHCHLTVDIGKLQKVSLSTGNKLQLHNFSVLNFENQHLRLINTYRIGWVCFTKLASLSLQT